MDSNTNWYVMGPIPVPMEDPVIHTDEHPWCSDKSCPCHTDSDIESLALRDRLLWTPYNNGLLTADEVVRIWYGRQDA